MAHTWFLTNDSEKEKEWEEELISCYREEIQLMKDLYSDPSYQKKSLKRDFEEEHTTALVYAARNFIDCDCDEIVWYRNVAACNTVEDYAKFNLSLYDRVERKLNDPGLDLFSFVMENEGLIGTHAFGKFSVYGNKIYRDVNFEKIIDYDTREKKSLFPRKYGHQFKVRDPETPPCKSFSETAILIEEEGIEITDQQLMCLREFWEQHPDSVIEFSV